MRKLKDFYSLINLDEAVANSLLEMDNIFAKKHGSLLLDLSEKAFEPQLTLQGFNQLIEKAHQMAKEVELNKYSIELLFVCYCLIRLEKEFEKSNISKALYIDTVSDIKCKIRECQETFNVNGIFVGEWYYHFCKLKILRLGGLEYETKQASHSYQNKGVRVEKGDKILSIHIPSDITLTHENVIESLKLCYKYYGFTGKVPFICDSWLLYPNTIHLFPQKGNIRRFISYFDIVDKKDLEGFVDSYRVFKCFKIADYDLLPTQTTLQRNFLGYLKAGGKTGDGIGFLVFDGQNIL